jgi:two-component system phosphate regulon sensor histidine kinase PhoR
MQAIAHEYKVILSLANSKSRRFISVLGDRERLTQVMTNLVNNAIKYNVPGGKVEVGYREQQDRAEIFVADTGRGIPAEHLPRIFERFYRVDKERSRAVGGTGLGLAIVKHIVEAHDSQVAVQSVVGKGSVFSFALKKK